MFNSSFRSSKYKPVPTILSGTTGNKWQTCCPHRPSGDNGLEIRGLKRFAKDWEGRAPSSTQGPVEPETRVQCSPVSQLDDSPRCPAARPGMACGGQHTTDERSEEWAVPGRCEVKQGRWGLAKGLVRVTSPRSSSQRARSERLEEKEKSGRDWQFQQAGWKS